MYGGRLMDSCSETLQLVRSLFVRRQILVGSLTFKRLADMNRAPPKCCLAFGWWLGCLFACFPSCLIDGLTAAGVLACPLARSLARLLACLLGWVVQGSIHFGNIYSILAFVLLAGTHYALH